MGHSPLQPLGGTGCSCPKARPSLSSLITNWAPSRPCLLSAACCPRRPGVGMCQAGHMLGGGGLPRPRSPNAWLFRCPHLPSLHPDQRLGPRTGRPDLPGRSEWEAENGVQRHTLPSFCGKHPGTFWEWLLLYSCTVLG